MEVHFVIDNDFIFWISGLIIFAFYAGGVGAFLASYLVVDDDDQKTVKRLSLSIFTCATLLWLISFLIRTSPQWMN